MTSEMKTKPQNAELEEKWIPKWDVGCRRFTPGVGYLEALGKENMEVVYGGIEGVSERGVVGEGGREYGVDVLICATGFDVSFKPRFPVIGPDGKNLQDEWKEEPKSYFGMAAAGFPNYLIFVGPNSPIGNGPVLSAIEAQADYMLKLIDHYQTHTHTTFSPTPTAVSAFIAHKNTFMSKTVWTSPCNSWYKFNTPSGPTITALWPGSTLHYIEAISYIRFEDWSLTYRDEADRFAYLGNGYSQTELDDTADWAYYIREVDDGEALSRGKRRREVSRSGTMVAGGLEEGVAWTGAGGGSALIPARGEAVRPRI